MPDADAAGGGHGVQRGRGGVVPGGGLAQHPGLRHLPPPPARRGEPDRPAPQRGSLPHRPPPPQPPRPGPAGLSRSSRATSPGPGGLLGRLSRARVWFPALRGPVQLPPVASAPPRVSPRPPQPCARARARSCQSPRCGAVPRRSWVGLRWLQHRVGLRGPCR